MTAQTFFSANSEALGETGRATVDSFGSHFLNPAAVAATSDYNLGAAFQETRPDSDNPINRYALVVSDNGPENVASASFGYVYKRSSFIDHIIVDQDFSICAATRILPKVAFGIQGRRLVRQNNNGPSWAKYNLALGFYATPAESLALAFVAYDVLTDDDLDMVPVLAIGATVNVMGVFRVLVDATRAEKKNPDHQATLNTGIEFDLGEGFLLRTGGIWDVPDRQTFWTAGLGWMGPRLNVAYAYKNNLNAAADIAHTIQAWLNF